MRCDDASKRVTDFASLYSFKYTLGIMSAIGFYMDVGTTTGKQGEKRVVITFNGKFLPHIEQKIDDSTALSPRD